MQSSKPKPDKGEFIKLCQVNKPMFFKMLLNGYIKDANTYIAGVKALFELGRLEW